MKGSSRGSLLVPGGAALGRIFSVRNIWESAAKQGLLGRWLVLAPTTFLPGAFHLRWNMWTQP